ncbi:hypothetical protein [Streptomyces sp. NPDC017520]|uniref:hypothetical protein n=1 Tax=Streptomyces sp. NPDC017520 TaxID=3364998 RepID=UPI0037BB6C0A
MNRRPPTADPRPSALGPRPSKGGDQLMFTYSDLGRLAECTAWVPGRIAHGC